MPKHIPYKSLERELFKSGYKFIISVDEVGVASLAGPVVTCAVLFSQDFYKKCHKKLNLLRESKLMNKNQREKYANILFKEGDLKYKITLANPKTIDRLNIYWAAKLAARRAIKNLIDKIKIDLIRKKGDSEKFRLDDFIVIVDGKNKIEGVKLDQLPIVKGDRKVFAIACASLIAKVFRDKIMVNYAKRFPQYGFEKHKGYPTKLHIENLRKYGICKIHRKSFYPITKLIKIL